MHQERPSELDTCVTFVASAAFEEPFEEPFESVVHEDFSLAVDPIETVLAYPADRKPTVC